MELSSPVVVINLKWGKQLLKGPQLTITQGLTTSDDLKTKIFELTGVPTNRQKLLAKGAWKGMLKDGVLLDNIANQNALTITLIGSADAPPAAKQSHRFEEDMTVEEISAVEAAQEQEALKNTVGMIVPLQRPPVYRKEDQHKGEWYTYNRLVNGLPQHQIEDLLKQRRDEGPSPLLGTVAMSLGMELRRAYVNALAVLPQDGTLLSAGDDGHVMGWKHGDCVLDVVHEGGAPKGVNCMVALPAITGESHLQPAFSTGGAGFIRLWSADGDCLQAFPCPPGTSPNAMVAMKLPDQKSICLATSFHITRQANPNQFRLLPQDEAGRQRRAEAQRQEAIIQENLRRISNSVQLIISTQSSGLQTTTLQPSGIAFPVTSLATLPNQLVHDQGENSTTFIVCGDSAGGLRFWHPRDAGQSNSDATLQPWSAQPWVSENLVQLCPSDNTSVASIECLQPLQRQHDLLAVSTRKLVNTESSFPRLANCVSIPVRTPQAVFLLDWKQQTIRAVIDAHKDSVICMTSLPDGGLVTGGGKLDATLKVWESSQWQPAQEENDSGAKDSLITDAKINLSNVGYSFALETLPDTKVGSNKYALAAARYNVVKICL